VDYLGYLLMAAGLFFVVSGLGLVRMPDLFTRMHAGTKATTLGSLLVLIGVGCVQPQWTGKLAILAAFTLLTNPLSSSVLARAAYLSGTDGRGRPRQALQVEGRRARGGSPKRGEDMIGLLALLLFAWMIAGALLAVRHADLLQTVVGLALVSLGAVGQFLLLQAPDVALTEAAIGVAAATFVLLMGVRQFGRREDRSLR